jgi:WS/DGAT/MGAT family acyltransferase
MTKRIPPLDLAFFLTESATAAKHVGAVMLFDTPVGREQFVAKVVAAYRKRTPTPPFNYLPKLLGAAMPHFEPAADYDPEYHVQHLVLPRASTYESFLKLIADLHEGILDRNRPLFRLWAIEGLPENRFALYLKIHHGIIDGASGVQRIYAALSADAKARIGPPAFAVAMPAPARPPRPPKDLLEQIASLRTKSTRQTVALADVYLGAIKRALGSLFGKATAGSVPFSASPSPMNAPLGVARSFATMSLPLAEMRAVGKAFGGTLNDVAATIVDEGVHRYLRAAGHEFDHRLVGFCPVSLREEGDTEAATKASAIFVPFGEAVATVSERMGQVMTAMAAAKQEMRAMSKDAAMTYAITALTLAELSEATGANRVARPLANVVVSNVPGAKQTMYLGGARLVGCYPISALAVSVGLNVTLTSYADSMDFGIVGNGMTLRDLPELARHMRDAYEALKAAVPVAAGKRAATRKKRTEPSRHRAI